MNTILLVSLIVGIACYLLTGILVALKKPYMTYERTKSMVILSTLLIMPYIVAVVF